VNNANQPVKHGLVLKLKSQSVKKSDDTTVIIQNDYDKNINNISCCNNENTTLIESINNVEKNNERKNLDVGVVSTPAPMRLPVKIKVSLKRVSYDSDDSSVDESHNTTVSSRIDRDKQNEYYYRHREEKLEYQKKYNKEREEKIKDYNKDYYNKQREKILAKAKTKVLCDCGCEVQLFNMNCHKKTRKHLRLVEAKKALLGACEES